MPDVSSLFGAIERWAIGLMELLGPAGAGAAVALENLFPPLPSEIILPLAGFAAHEGTFTLTAAILWTTGGSVVGALALYLLGVVVGRERLMRLAGWGPLLDPADVVRAEHWFERHGRRAVLFGRMIPIVRSMISIPAGVARMPLPTFLGYTLLGSLIWNSLFIGAGYLLGAQWPIIERYAGVYSRVTLVLVAGLAGVFVVRRVRRRDTAAGSRNERPS